MDRGEGVCHLILDTRSRVVPAISSERARRARAQDLDRRYILSSSGLVAYLAVLCAHHRRGHTDEESQHGGADPGDNEVPATSRHPKRTLDADQYENDAEQEDICREGHGRRYTI